MEKGCIGDVLGIGVWFWSLRLAAKGQGCLFWNMQKGPSPLREIHISLKPEANGLIDITYCSHQL